MGGEGGDQRSSTTANLQKTRAKWKICSQNLNCRLSRLLGVLEQFKHHFWSLLSGANFDIRYAATREQRDREGKNEGGN